jgi:outer membrane receptor protein involved in Fe transport
MCCGTRPFLIAAHGLCYAFAVHHHFTTNRVMNMRFARTAVAVAMLLLVPVCLHGQDPEGTLSLDSLLEIRVSSAGRYKQTIHESPAAISVITSEDIEKYGVQTLGEALSLAHGIFVSYDYNYTYIGIRGFSRPTDWNNRILMQIDGHSINEPEYGSAPIGIEFPVPLDMIDRIEVVRGPGSVLFGTGAMFGVVNIITKKPDGGPALRVKGEVGSLGARSATVALQYQFEDGTGARAVIQRQTNEGTDHFFREYAVDGSDGMARGLDGEDASSAYLGLNRRDLSLAVRWTERTKDVPTGSWEVDFGVPGSTTFDRRAAIAISYRRGLSASTEAFAGASYEDYRYVGSFPSNGTIWHDATDAEWAQGGAGLLWDIGPRARLVSGVEALRVIRSDYKTFDQSELWLSKDLPYHGLGIYSQLESNLTSRLKSIVGISYDYRSFGSSSTTPRLAMLYSASERTTLKAMYGQAFRSPNAYETWGDGIFKGGGEPKDLETETIRTSEVSLESSLSAQVHLSGSVYHNRLYDLIDFVPTSDAESGSYGNIGNVESIGIEGALRILDAAGLSAYFTMAYQSSRDLEASTAITNSPKLIATAGISGRFAHATEATMVARYESGRKTLLGNETDAFTRLDVNVATSGIFPWMRVRALVKNVFDTEYGYPGGAEHRQDILMQPGRTFTLRVEAILK